MNTWKSNQALSKYMSYALFTFYAFALGVIVFLVFYWLIDKETFYFLDDKIHIATSTSYSIEVIGKSEGKNNEDFTWTSSNPEVIEVDESGNVKALQQGIATITATSKLGLVKRSIRVSASDFMIYSIVFENERMVIGQGEEVILQPILNGEKNIRTNLTWLSSDPTVVSVDENGKIVGKSGGTATITAMDEYSEHSAKVRVDVTESIAVKVEDEDEVNDGGDTYEQDTHQGDVNIISISMKPRVANLQVGDTTQLAIEIQPSNATNQTIHWNSSNTSIATVDENGKVSAIGEGTCVIYAVSEDGNKKTYSMVTVSKKEIPVESISLEKKNYTMNVGDKIYISSTVYPSDATNQKVKWQSANTGIATVDSRGIVTAKASGSVEITATTEDGNYQSTAMVTVNEPVEQVVYMDKITLSYGKNQLELGSSADIKAEYSPSNVTNSNIVYKSSMEEVISITADGVMTANKAGFSIITATSQDGKASASLLIMVPPKKVSLEDIIFSNDTYQMKIGEDYTISYSLIPPYAISGKVVWTTSNDTIATVNDSGVVTGVGEGTVTITATIEDTSIQTSMRIAVVPNNEMISLQNQSLKAYQTDIYLEEYQKNYSRAMQNFAIDGIGTSNEIFYFSYPSVSNFSTKKKLTDAKKSGLVRTVIQKKTTSQLKNSKSSYMFLNGTGHGQSFDYAGGEIWVNGDGYISESNDLYWGYYRSIIETTFKANTPTSSFSYNKKITISSNDGANYGNPEVSIDEENDMMAVRSGRKVFVYQWSEAKAGNKVLLYEFTISDTVDGKNYSRQGHDISNGYYYQYRGEVGSSLYIEVYNMLGELQYVKKTNVSMTKAEAEGLKIYNHQVYVGVTYETSKAGRYNAIYYFQ